jgi:hypothetical protein
VGEDDIRLAVGRLVTWPLLEPWLWRYAAAGPGSPSCCSAVAVLVLGIGVAVNLLAGRCW